MSSIERSRRRKKYFDKNGNFALRPYTTSDLCKIYRKSFPTIKKDLDRLSNKIGKKEGYFFSIRQVQIITDALGIPFGHSE